MLPGCTILSLPSPVWAVALSRWKILTQLPLCQMAQHGFHCTRSGALHIKPCFSPSFPCFLPHPFIFPNWVALLYQNLHCCQSKTTAPHWSVAFMYAELLLVWLDSSIANFWGPQNVVFSELWLEALQTVKVTVQPITTQAINASHVFEWLRAGEDVWAHDITLSFIMQKLKIVPQTHVLNHNDHHLL